MLEGAVGLASFGKRLGPVGAGLPQVQAVSAMELAREREVRVGVFVAAKGGGEHRALRARVSEAEPAVPDELVGVGD